jgi:hypothetical protein
MLSSWRRSLSHTSKLVRTDSTLQQHPIRVSRSTLTMKKTLLAALFIASSSGLAASPLSAVLPVAPLPDGEGRCYGCDVFSPPNIGPEAVYLRVWTGGPLGDPASYALAAKFTATGTLIGTASTCRMSYGPDCEASCDASFSTTVQVDLYTGVVDVSEVSIELEATDGGSLGGSAGPETLGDVASGASSLVGFVFVDTTCGDQSARYVSFDLDWSTVAWPQPLPPDYVPPHYFEESPGSVGPASDPSWRIVGDRSCCLEFPLECERCVPRVTP